MREEETDTKRVREYGGRPESSPTQRKSFVQQMITLVEQMPHQLPVRSLPKSLNQGGTERGLRERAHVCVREVLEQRCLGVEGSSCLVMVIQKDTVV